MSRQELQGFRFEKVKSTKGTSAAGWKKALTIIEPSKEAPPKDAKENPKAKERVKALALPKEAPRKKAADGSDSQPRVLVERKELQALQSERRTLFGRIDEVAEEAKALRETVRQREEEINVARVAAAQCVGSRQKGDCYGSKDHC